MYIISVILKGVSKDIQLSTVELLKDSGSNECGCVFDVCYNTDNGHVYIEFERNATSLIEALCDVAFELDHANLLNFVKSIERGF